MKTINDQSVLEIVSNTVDAANERGENWADVLDIALEEAGVKLHDDQPDGSDAWEIVRLDDGRMVYLSDESATGAGRYRIA